MAKTTGRADQAVHLSEDTMHPQSPVVQRCREWRPTERVPDYARGKCILCAAESGEGRAAAPDIVLQNDRIWVWSTGRATDLPAVQNGGSARYAKHGADHIARTGSSTTHILVRPQAVDPDLLCPEAFSRWLAVEGQHVGLHAVAWKI